MSVWSEMVGGQSSGARVGWRWRKSVVAFVAAVTAPALLVVGAGAANAAGLAYAYTVGPPTQVGGYPDGMAVDQSTHAVYVSSEADNVVSEVDGLTGAVVGAPIPVGSDPRAIAVDPVTRMVYVANSDDNTVSVIDGATRTVVGAPIPVGGFPFGAAVDPGTHMFYFTNLRDNTVSVIDGATRTVVGAPIPVGRAPYGVAVDPGTHMVYVANSSNNTVSVIDGANRTIVGTPIPVGSFPYGVVVDPGTHLVYVTNLRDNTVSVIDGATRTVVGAPIPVGTGPEKLGLDSSTGTLYVANFNAGSVSVIDVTTRQVTNTIALPGTPYAVGVDLTTHTAWVSQYDSPGSVIPIRQTPRVNSPPVAQPGTASTTQGKPVDITLRATDPDAGDTLSYRYPATTVQGGTLTPTTDPAVVTYTPPPTLVGVDSFTFTVTDQAGATSEPAPVTVTVDPRPNLAPTASNGTATTTRDTPASVTLQASDPDGDTLSYQYPATTSAGGTLTGTTDPAKVKYTPKAGYTGADSFTFTASDGKDSSNTATVSITVTAPANTAPVSSNGSVSTTKGKPVTVTLKATDKDGDPLTYAVVAQPANGKVVVNGTGPTATYTPNPGYAGTDTFTFKANDGKADSNVATETVTVGANSCGQASTPTVDATVSMNQTSPASSFTSPALTTMNAGDLLVAYVAADGPQAATQTVTSVTGGGLTWTLVARSNATWGTAEVWQAYAPAKLTGVKVTASLNNKPYDGQITVTAFSGAAKQVGASGIGSGTGKTASASLTPKSCSSRVFGIGHDWSMAVKPTPAAGQTLQQTFMDTKVHDTYWVQAVTAPTTTAKVTVSDTLTANDRWQLVAVEIPSINA